MQGLQQTLMVWHLGGVFAILAFTEDVQVLIRQLVIEQVCYRLKCPKLWPLIHSLRNLSHSSEL